MNIRKYAKECGVEVVGKLHRFPNPIKLNRLTDMYGESWKSNDRCFVDEAGNEFILCTEGGILIITADGSVI